MANGYGGGRMSTPRRTTRRNTRTTTTRRNNSRMMRRTNTGRNNNPITRTFNAPQSPRYYRPNGQVIPVGAPLHQHQDGTIMTEHAMGPNDNAVVVSTNRGNGRMNGRTNGRRMNGRRMNGRRMNGRQAMRGRNGSFHGSGVVPQPGLVRNSDPVGGSRTYIQSGNDILSCPPGSMVITNQCVKVVNPYLSNV
tara:strand:+ start:384 stop:962 length:579 start_codon:yes stop_codon:yes gene_type:complete